MSIEEIVRLRVANRILSGQLVEVLGMRSIHEERRLVDATLSALEDVIKWLVWLDTNPDVSVSEAESSLRLNREIYANVLASCLLLYRMRVRREPRGSRRMP